MDFTWEGVYSVSEESQASCDIFESASSHFVVLNKSSTLPISSVVAKRKESFQAQAEGLEDPDAVSRYRFWNLHYSRQHKRGLNTALDPAFLDFNKRIQHLFQNQI